MADPIPVTEEPLAISGKLGIRPGHQIVLVHPPTGFALSDLPPTASLSGGEGPPEAAVDVVIAFFTAADVLRREVDDLARRIPDSGALWLAWPRRAGGGSSDITDNLVREAGLASGLVDVKVAALGMKWSGLRFVRRLADRTPPARR